MRRERRDAIDAAEAIKSAGRHAAARFDVLVSTMEKEGHFATRSMGEIWDELVQPFLETVSGSPSFESKWGSGIEAYGLFMAAAKLEFDGVINLRENSKSVTYETDAYVEAQMEGIEEDDEAMARAS